MQRPLTADRKIARNSQIFCSPAQWSSKATLFSFFCFIDHLSFPSETENSSLNFGRASIVTGTSSGISPSSKCRTREQVRQTNSKSWVTMKITFPISDNLPDQPCHLRHTVKVQATGRFIEYQAGLSHKSY